MAWPAHRQLPAAIQIPRSRRNEQLLLPDHADTINKSQTAAEVESEQVV